MDWFVAITPQVFQYIGNVTFAALAPIEASRDWNQTPEPDRRGYCGNNGHPQPEQRLPKNHIRLLKLCDEKDRPKSKWHEHNQRQFVVDALFPLFRQRFASPSSYLRQPDCSLFREHSWGVNADFYRIEPQLSAKKYLLSCAVLVTCRTVDVSMPAVSPKAASLRFWYGASIAEFVGASAEKIVGQLTLNSSFDIDRSQAAAWLAEIEFLQSKLSDLAGSIFFEFNIPRMGRRIDVVLVIGPVIFAIEFKVGEKTFDRSAIDQVWDYGLDLKNFHEASHDASIVPILIATEATECPPLELAR